jgi:hypothetical protein
MAALPGRLLVVGSADVEGSGATDAAVVDGAALLVGTRVVGWPEAASAGCAEGVGRSLRVSA